MPIALPAVMAEHLPGRAFASALDAADAYARSGGPMLFGWEHSRKPVAQRATIRGSLEYALIRAVEGLRVARDAHRWFVARRNFPIAAHHRRTAGYWAALARFFRAALAELRPIPATLAEAA